MPQHLLGQLLSVHAVPSPLTTLDPLQLEIAGHGVGYIGYYTIVTMTRAAGYRMPLARFETKQERRELKEARATQVPTPICKISTASRTSYSRSV